MLPTETLAALELTLQRLVRDYQELNARFVPEISHTPTPLELSRSVAANRPLILRGQGYRDGIPALTRWSNAYLVEKLKGRAVAVAVSPDGQADSIINGHFVEPASVDMKLEELFASLNPPPAEDSSTPPPVLYLQSQNGNLAETGELHPLLEDVGDGPSWAQEVFGEPPDVANVWIGDSRSVTSMHKDPYENIYLVIRGSKTFTLMPPSEYYCLHERDFPSAHYTYTAPSTFTLTPSSPPAHTPWIPVDPTSPNLSLYPRFAHARPLSVTLEAGDMLYLPSMWFHRVAQDVGPSPAAGDEGEGDAVLACNWWFDMRMDAPVWSNAAFVRRVTGVLDGRVEEWDDGDDSE